ncbi:hypothetical protein M3484_14380 [Pseudomonas sp. GX19020]|uniref:hypothetical protein n=1 Tax=Pseudomonas sp. GX19020 TaxID=2942277 RepID=UPI0020184C73|nr:hypothetical protein [Pseudomonas sp. GX19020]MCL4067761.1 hypothetical protein [Pseudomonas sp. GX19020]
MEGRFKSGTILSGAGHAGLILWVMIGDWFFSPSPPAEPMSMSVSTISPIDFAALEAAAPKPSDDTAEPGETIATPDPVEPSVDEPVSEPTAEPQPQPEPQPEPTPAPRPDPTPEPTPQPIPEPVISNPAPPDAIFAPEEQPIPTMSTSPRPKPRPAERVAPNPVVAPEDTLTAERPQDQVTTSEEPTPEPPREDQQATTEVNSGDVLITEANQQDRDAEPLGPSTSPRPKPRPNRTAPTPEPAREPTPEPAGETQDQRDARIAAEVAAADRAQAEAEAKARREAAAREKAAADAEAAAIAAAVAAANTGSGGQGQAASGPPLSGGEMGDIAAAIGSKWNVGTLSADAMDAVVVLRVTFDESGRPGSDMPLIESRGPSQQAIQAAYNAARSAIARAYQSGGIPLPPGKYETWKVLEFEFDGSGMRLR